MPNNTARYIDFDVNYLDAVNAAYNRPVIPPPLDPIPPARLSLREAGELYRKNKITDLKYERDEYRMETRQTFVYEGYLYIGESPHNYDGNNTGFLRHRKVVRTAASANIIRNEENMFASRKEDDGVIRLCIRRGRVIKSTQIGDTIKNITFATAALAKQCSDELNEKYFNQYDLYMDRENHPRQAGVRVPDELRKGMIEVISKYATLTEDNGSTGN